jgi:hypothetical protein
MRIKKSKLKQIIREELNEAGFARTRQAMTGVVPTIETIAFLTGENPGGEPAPRAVNKENNAALEKSLRAGNYGFRKIKGKFGSPEKSFMVMNIPRSEATALGQDLGQESIIWGRREEDEEGAYFNFEYIEGETTIQTRQVSMSGRDVQDRDDFYSQVKGRKFLIPFFDDEYEGASMKVKADLNELTEKQRAAYGKYVKCVQQSLLETKTPKYRWQKRGVAQVLLRKVKER